MNNLFKEMKIANNVLPGKILIAWNSTSEIGKKLNLGRNSNFTTWIGRVASMKMYSDALTVVNFPLTEITNHNAEEDGLYNPRKRNKVTNYWALMGIALYHMIKQDKELVTLMGMKDVNIGYQFSESYSTGVEYNRMAVRVNSAVKHDNYIPIVKMMEDSLRVGKFGDIEWVCENIIKKCMYNPDSPILEGVGLDIDNKNKLTVLDLMDIKID